MNLHAQHWLIRANSSRVCRATLVVVDEEQNPDSDSDSSFESDESKNRKLRDTIKSSSSQKKKSKSTLHTKMKKHVWKDATTPQD
jgi:hypothetical protein